VGATTSKLQMASTVHGVPSTADQHISHNGEQKMLSLSMTWSHTAGAEV
jgi:hypothetical protein